MTVKEIVEKYLRDNGHDGLVGDDGCGCTLDGLVPCETIPEDCIAGKKIICKPEDCEELSCMCDGYEEGKYRMEES